MLTSVITQEDRALEKKATRKSRKIGVNEARVTIAGPRIKSIARPIRTGIYNAEKTFTRAKSNETATHRD